MWFLDQKIWFLKPKLFSQNFHLKIYIVISNGINGLLTPDIERKEVVSTNIDCDGNLLSSVVNFSGKQHRLHYFNHSLLYLTFLHRKYAIGMDFSRAYDELHEYLRDENAWISPGMHYLVLKKRH